MTITSQSTVRVGITVKSCDLHMYSSEIHKLVTFIVDYVYLDTIFLAYDRYLKLAHLRAADIHPVRARSSALEFLTVQAENIAGCLYGYSYTHHGHLAGRHTFPASNMTISIPNFKLSYDFSQTEVISHCLL